MIDRYTRPEMGAIWTKEAQYQAWLDVELAACWAWAEATGQIPHEDVETLYRDASFSVDRIHEIEAETRHDVVAFTRAVSETLGPERKWVHYGLTSSDVVDTAQSLRLLRANEILRGGVERLAGVLAERAVEHKHTVTVGRTHGVHAEPTTFGLKLARFYDAVQRDLARFDAAAEAVRVGKLSGAVGTFANIPPEVERLTCERLGLRPAPISTQVLPRDLHAQYLGALALVGTTIETVAVEVRHLQRSEVLEAEEAFRPGQKGSSAMPHKRNPIGSENLTGMARLLRGYMVAAYEDVALWHERDISHSSVERVILPDATTALDYALARLARIVENLTVYPDRMAENLERTYGLVYSQRLLLMLIETGLSREAAYDAVQPLAMQAWRERRSFREIVEAAPSVADRLSPVQIADAFDPAYHQAHVDEIFERVGLG
ncbi:adenylosuccinate lyase [Rubrivirga sp. S365]|uniref:Adenylosuccinate lyase n=1 Tax=Rubrivirga litoralis TaxID=3075598 RepID=A0ABU3BM43_9BACT|nr:MULTISPECIES: adenylosuccinate lyase [unclassified Rubrivirga]MDT0630340.1 adenylosuccinate lyase [Rubrivirga sp. F394]MDT7855851.1 adenylosuccinate lyase [Rubrivirga sp. S365]